MLWWLKHATLAFPENPRAWDTYNNPLLHGYPSSWVDSHENENCILPLFLTNTATLTLRMLLENMKLLPCIYHLAFLTNVLLSTFSLYFCSQPSFLSSDQHELSFPCQTSSYQPPPFQPWLCLRPLTVLYLSRPFNPLLPSSLLNLGPCWSTVLAFRFLMPYISTFIS